MKKLLLVVLSVVIMVGCSFADSFTDSIKDYWDANSTSYNLLIYRGEFLYSYTDWINDEEVYFTIVPNEDTFTIGSTLKSYDYPKFGSDLSNILMERFGFEDGFVFAFANGWVTALNSNPVSQDTYQSTFKYDGVTYVVEAYVSEEKNIVSISVFPE